MAIELTVITGETATLNIESASQVELSAEASILVDRSSIYSGGYEWTPTEEAQTIEIAGTKALENITINPIPSNYGLITWDGNTLTVS